MTFFVTHAGRSGEGLLCTFILALVIQLGRGKWLVLGEKSVEKERNIGEVASVCIRLSEVDVLLKSA